MLYRMFVSCFVLILAASGWAKTLPTTSPEALAVTPSARPAPSTPAEVHFAVIGDFGDDTLDHEAKVARLVDSWNPDFIITTGDNNYPKGKASTIEANIGKYYGKYIAHNGNPSANRFFPALGNHDWETPGAQPYIDYFELPGNERYYQFRRGPVEFFALDSDPREPDGVLVESRQGDWLKAALGTSDAPWKVVFFHHPPYSSGHHGSNVWMQWPFQKWGASVVLCGHDHDYERVVVQDFPYFVVGLGGAKIGKFKKVPAIPGADEDFGFDQTHGAMRVDATDTKITLRFFTHEKALIDTYEMSRTVSPAPGPNIPN